MDPLIAVPALLVMLIGLAGVAVPVLPGLSLVWLAAIGSMILAGWSGGAWVTAAVVTTVFAGAQIAEYALPARAGRASGAPRSSLLTGAALGIVGFFLIPVVGFVVGGVGGVYLAERSRLGQHAAAWRTTWSVLKSVGFAALLQLLAGILIIAVWAVHILW